jgi:biotin carboxyl carrier protein
MRLTVSVNGTSYELEMEPAESGWRCLVDGREMLADVAQIAPDLLSILLNGRSYDVNRGPDGTLTVGEERYLVSVIDPRSWRSRRQSAAGALGPQKLTASMPGKVIRVLTASGSKILAGEGLVVIEAMKMQNEVRSPRDGTVSAILVREGSTVNSGEVVAIVE